MRTAAVEATGLARPLRRNHRHPACTMARLLVQTGDGQKTTYPIGETAVVGRGYSVDVPIIDSKASRMHAKITRDGDGYVVQDMGSRNGTYLNGDQVLEKRPLSEGDVIRIGRTTLLFGENETHRPSDTTVEEAPNASKPSGKSRIGSFEILERIGGGGMADVYKAKHVENDMVVALKVIKEAIAAKPQFVRRFHDKEAQIARRLEHPNLIEIYEDGVADGKDFLAMEYVDGASLLERTVHKPADLEEALEIIKQAARGLTEAHGNGVVHRDIKLSNILFRNPERTAALRPGRRPLLSLRAASSPARGETGSAERAAMAAELPEPEFVGREMDMRRLETALRRCRAGTDPFIVVRGEAGWGKRRMLREFAKCAEDQGTVVLWASRSDTGSRDPFERIVCTLFERLTELPAEEWSQDIRGWVSVLLSACPHASPRPAGIRIVEDPGLPAQRTAKAACELARTLRGESPLCVILDDLQDSDVGDFERLEAFLQHARHSETLVCGTFRDTRALRFAPFARVMSRLAEASLCSEMFLKPLPRFAVLDIVDSIIGSRHTSRTILDEVLHLTGGSPREVVQLMGKLVTDGILVKGSGEQWVLCPEGVSDLDAGLADKLRDRFERRGADARRILCAAATLDDHATFDLLQRLTGVKERALFNALEDLVRRDFLYMRQEAGQSEYCFTSERFKAYLYGNMLGRDRVQFHRTAAQIIEKEGGDGDETVDTLAYHFANAQDFEKAIVYLIRSGRAARERYETDAAQTAFQRAASLLDASARNPRQHKRVTRHLEKFYGPASDYQKTLQAEMEISKPPFIKIADFGLAVTEADDMSPVNGRVPGTARYMSPEQIRGKNLDGKSDIFSLGIAAFEMLTAKQPFRARERRDYLLANLNDELPKVCSVRKSFPRQIDVILAKMTAKSKSNRYTAEALVRDIERLQLRLPLAAARDDVPIETADPTSAFFIQNRAKGWPILLGLALLGSSG